jgi:hypothetical protein
VAAELEHGDLHRLTGAVRRLLEDQGDTCPASTGRRSVRSAGAAPGRALPR